MGTSCVHVERLAVTELKAGVRLKSVVCTTEIVVVRAPNLWGVEVLSGGEPMVELAAKAPSRMAMSDDGPGTLLGKRYVDDDLEFEVLCTKGGEGTLEVKGRAMRIKAAEPLPSSD